MDKIKYGTTLSPLTVEKIKKIADTRRWDANDVIEVAIDELFKTVEAGQDCPETIEQDVEAHR